MKRFQFNAKHAKLHYGFFQNSEPDFSFTRQESNIIYFLMANFGPFSIGQPHQPDVNHCVLNILTRRSPEAS